MPTRPSPFLIVTGTGTAVGKTTVTTGLLALALARGAPLAPFKPAETGLGDDPTTSDGHRLREASGLSLPLSEVCPHQFRPPVAPAAAAADAGTELSLEAMVAHAQGLAARHRGVLIEGAGGVLSPYGPAWTIVDLARELDAPMLLVSVNALGTINHTVLALRELARSGIRLAGALLVDHSPSPSPDHGTNAEWIERMTGTRATGPLACLSPADARSPKTVAVALARHPECLAWLPGSGP